MQLNFLKVKIFKLKKNKSQNKILHCLVLSCLRSLCPTCSRTSFVSCFTCYQASYVSKVPLTKSVLMPDESDALCSALFHVHRSLCAPTLHVPRLLCAFILHVLLVNIYIYIYIYIYILLILFCSCC